MRLSLVLLSVPCCLSEMSQAVEPRNIVFILVDDQRHDALSCLGHPFLKTPAADSLVKGGVRFANA